MSFNTGNNTLDSLVYSSWFGLHGSPVQLTYSFLTRSPGNATADDRNGFRAMSATQESAVRDALSKWSSVANITFTETVSNTGNLQFGTNNQGSDSSAYAYLPASGVTSLAMYTNTQNSYNSVFTPGTYGPTVLIHEIGHLLGLKHPGDYDSTGATTAGPFLPAATDNGDYTQMSYNHPTSWSINRTYATTPMLYDIQAMQYLYGANMSYHAGDDTYAFTSGSAPLCVWDAGGNNTFDFSACFGGTTINLNAGTFSETAYGLKNVSIAYGVTVQKAIAGSGGSTIYANDAGNTLVGGNGADVFHEGGGNDTISGGAGVDTVVFEGTFARYSITSTAAGLTVSGDGLDLLSGVETLRFDDRTVQVSDLAGALAGTAGNDRLTAPAGNVSIDGGAGLDTVVFGGNVSAYHVTANAGTVTVSGNGVTDLLVNVERLAFADGALALDTQTGTAGQVYRLYEATLERAPDAGGMGFWLAARDNGVPMESLAHSFIASPEFVGKYGNLDNSAFVQQLYRNVLDREPDPSGFAWHVANLDHGVSRETTVLNFSESPEFIASLVGQIPVGVAYTPFVG
jgi:serralysin